MNYSKYLNFDTMNGPGIRVTLFVSGCTLNCPGCFNKEAQNFKFGNPYTQDITDQIINDLSNDDISGISILGGDPLMTNNFQTVYDLCVLVKTKCPSKTIWMWSGRTLEEIVDSEYAPILNVIDTLVDGRYDETKSAGIHRYRGSSNQRVLHKGVDF